MGGYGRYTNKSSFIQRRKELRGSRQTKAERTLWKYIRAKQLGVKFRRQYNIGLYIVNVYCHELKLIIELDGWVHGEDEQKKKDVIRQRWFELQGYIVKRYRNEQIKYEIKDVLQDIVNTINRIQATKDPS